MNSNCDLFNKNSDVVSSDDVNGMLVVFLDGCCIIRYHKLFLKHSTDPVNKFGG